MKPIDVHPTPWGFCIWFEYKGYVISVRADHYNVEIWYLEDHKQKVLYSADTNSVFIFEDLKAAMTWVDERVVTLEAEREARKWTEEEWNTMTRSST